jgi:hypothetical protein
VVLGVSLYRVEEVACLLLEVSCSCLVPQGPDLRADVLELRSHLRELGAVRPPLGPEGRAVQGDVAISLV